MVQAVVVLDGYQVVCHQKLFIVRFGWKQVAKAMIDSMEHVARV
jgi:hypothetical protein